MTNYEVRQGIQTTKDLSPVREFHIEDSSQIIYVKRENPYGFWYISFKHGTIPAEMEQAFTTFTKAKEAVDNYLRDRYAREERRTVKANKVKLTPPVQEKQA